MPANNPAHKRGGLSRAWPAPTETGHHSAALGRLISIAAPQPGTRRIFAPSSCSFSSMHS